MGAFGATSLAVFTAAAFAVGGSAPHSALADVAAPSPTAASNGSGPGPQHVNVIVNTSPPTITGLELQPLVAPGGVIKIDGQNFGAQRGLVCLQWSTVLVQNVFTAHNSLCLTVVDWQDTRVIALVPDDVVGVPDQTAGLAIYVAEGGKSNTVDMRFVATRQEVLYSGQPVNATVECGDETEKDNCSIGGADHWDGFWYSFGNSGTDHFHVELANGWTLERFEFNPFQGNANLQGRPRLGGSTIDFSVQWSVGGTQTETAYGSAIWLLGPKGVPMK